MRTFLAPRSVPAVAAIAALAACGSIRVVKTTPTGGVLALQGSEREARQKAEQHMASRCPQGYDIVEEGEAVVGSTAETQEGPKHNVLGMKVKTQTTEARDVTEWRIIYECRQPAQAAQ